MVWFGMVWYGVWYGMMGSTAASGKRSAPGVSQDTEQKIDCHVQAGAATKGPVSVKEWESYLSGLHAKCFDVTNNDGFDRLADNHFGHVVDDIVPYVKAHLTYGLPQTFLLRR